MEDKKKAKNVRCPRCGGVQPIARVCRHCGLDFVHYVKQKKQQKADVAHKTPGEPSAEKPSAEKPSAEKPSAEKPSAEKPSAEKPSAEKPREPGEPTAGEKAAEIKKLREISSVYEERKDLESIEATFSSAWGIYRRRWATLVVLHLLTIVFPVLGFAIFAGLGALLAMAAPDMKEAAVAIGVLLGAAAAMKGWVWAMAALTFAVVDDSLGVGAALRKGRERFLSFLWLYTLLAFIIMGGLMLFIVPGIIFLVWFAPAQYVLASEDIRGMRALLKSKEYVKDRWLDVFLKLLLVWLLAMAVGSIPVVGLIFFMPFMMLYIFVIYENLKEVKWVVAFPDSAAQKLKWVAVGALGYVLPPVLLFTLVGASLDTGLSALVSAFQSRGTEVRTPSPEAYEPPRAAAPAPRAPAEALSPALQGLQGVWQGRNVSDGSQWTIAISGSTLATTDSKGRLLYSGTIAVDDTKSPRHIDTTIRESSEQRYMGLVSRGIYMQEGALFILCASEPGLSRRPADFDPVEGLSVCFELSRTPASPPPAAGAAAPSPDVPASATAVRTGKPIDNMMLHVYAINYRGSVRLNGKEVYRIKGERDMNYNSTAPAALVRGTNVFQVDYTALPGKPSVTEIRIRVFRYDWDTGGEETYAEWKITDPGGSKRFELLM